MLRTNKLMILTALICLPLLADDGTVRVPEGEGRKLVASRVEPEYPAIAKQIRLAGSVMVDVYLDAEGKMEKVQVVNGHPLLSSATVNAIKKWRFSPFMADGKASKAVVRFNVNFQL